MQDETYRVRAPAVVSENIDGEVVIMNLKSGNYYSIQNTGAQVWEWIERGLSHGQLIDILGRKYDVQNQDVDTALTSFVTQLKEELLIDLVNDSADEAVFDDLKTDLEANGTVKEPFQAPVLEVYSDMQDLLLLDPIHDVDETGWPTPKDS